MVDLKKNITSHGVTLVELAQRMGTSQQAVSQAVHGNPSLSYLQRMADAIGIPLSELVNDVPTDQTEPLMRCPHCGEPIKVSIE
jgi:transcriptional regulator with XRE-family HTH domain